jgi:hypothetical protein
LRGGKNYYRWCFPDSVTALAFVEQFGGRSFRLGSGPLQQTPPHSPRQHDERLGVVAPQKQTIKISEPSL